MEDLSRHSGAGEESQPIVFIIDDDSLYRASTERLIRSVGFRVQSFESAREFLNTRRPNVASCLILDVRMPGLSGLDLQLSKYLSFSLPDMATFQ
jgi:FixJ family two-component response regulator